MNIHCKSHTAATQVTDKAHGPLVYLSVCAVFSRVYLVVLSINISCVLIDSVSKTMLSILDSEHSLDVSRFLNQKINPFVLCGPEVFLYQIISALIIPLEVAFGRALLRCRCMNVSVGFIKVSKHKTPILLNLIKVAGLVSSSNSVNNF